MAVSLRAAVAVRPSGPPRASARPAAARRTPAVPSARPSLATLKASSSNQAETSSDKATPQEEAPTVCQTCGVPISEMPGGCDGLGRQAGGVGAVIDWWPIKAYRPCPTMTAAGGKYKRKGQITDEMLFGKGKK